VTRPHDYLERTYAGVLGKIIGVYLGRPFEGWPYERIQAELGEINYYVHDRLGRPLIVPDDDISGTFTFFRALADYGYDPHITAKQIGQTWLNYLIENRTVLWWGGMGNSTEHTAYLNLKRGIKAPQSGSRALNGRVVSEQIGAQIFIDAWGLVAPGDPAFAADLARRAASVSHDGEAVYGAQIVAALVAQAFVEDDLETMLDTAVAFIPRDSVIYRLIADLREWRDREPDWRRARELLEERYGYHIYGGNCHIVPNHGLVLLGLLYGDGDFQRSLMITNTCGWDTDCNAGNVGCFMGVWKGLAGIEAGPDWRGPVADRLLLPTADGGRCITDAVRETYSIVNASRALGGREPLTPKGGARFHFELPGSVQGFTVEDNVESRGTATVRNSQDSGCGGERSLAIAYAYLATGTPARIATPTFVTPDLLNHHGYGVLASPTLYPGQELKACLSADNCNETPVVAHLFIHVYEGQELTKTLLAPGVELVPGSRQKLKWIIPDTDSNPIMAVGVQLSSPSGKRTDGTVYLHYMDWTGQPTVTWRAKGQVALRAWTNGVDQLSAVGGDFRLIQNEGAGLAIQGEGSWADYTVTAEVRPHAAKSAGIAARVQGMRRYYALLLDSTGHIRLVKEGDGRRILAEREFPWEFGSSYALALEVRGPQLVATVDGEALLSATDNERPLCTGAVAMICEEGRVAFGPVSVGA
jgi:ADP-ribosylglycohydrolase